MSDIFLSYAREDRAVAAALAELLDRAGFEVFWDHELYAGADFEQEIGAELASAKAVIVIWTATSRKSGWVRDEAAAAAERGVLVPVRLDDQPSPFGSRSLHVIQLDLANLSELLRAIVRLTQKAPKTPPAAPVAVQRPAGIGIVEGAVLLLVAAAVGWFLLLMAR